MHIAAASLNSEMKSIEFAEHVFNPTGRPFHLTILFEKILGTCLKIGVPGIQNVLRIFYLKWREHIDLFERYGIQRTANSLGMWKALRKNQPFQGPGVGSRSPSNGSKGACPSESLEVCLNDHSG